MPRTRRAGALLLVAALVAIVLGGCAPAVAPSGSPAASVAEGGSVEARVNRLLGLMTTDEKIGQLTLIENGSIDPAGVTKFLVGAC